MPPRLSLTLLSAPLLNYGNVFRQASRQASTSANPYPYPTHSNPTPHQIFHLPLSATRNEVKARYYELVRIYHPDSPVSRPLPSATAQARFQSITAAYDALRGKKPPPGESSSGARVDTHSVGAAAWRARMRRRAELNTGLDDRWKDRLMLGTVLMSVGAFVWQTYSTRREAIASIETRRQAGAQDEFAGILSTPRRRKEAIHDARREEDLRLAATEEDVK